MRKRNLEFASDTSVFALFRKLGRIPQSRTIKSPIGANAFRQHDLGMLDALFPSEVMNKAIALIGQANGAPISGRCYSAAAG